jgi:tetratricopeptide (TPR) repeat protein
VLAKLARYEEAAAAFESTLKLDPKCETAVSMLIRSLALLGRHEEAETAYYLALHSIERPATSHLEIARSLMARGDVRRAEHCYRRAIAEGPTLVGARIELARTLLLVDRGAETATLLAEEFRRGAVPPPLALEAVRIHLASGRAAEAAQLLDQLARVDPSNPKLHLLFARALRRRGDLMRAARHGEVATRLAPELPGLALEGALLAVAQGRPEAARPLLEKEFDVTEGRERPMLTDRLDVIETMQALLAVGMPANAEKMFLARFGAPVLRGESDDPELLRIAARIAFERGRNQHGRACSRRLLRLDPKSISAMHNLALLAIERRRYRIAHEWIRRARKIDPADAGLRKLRTLCFVKRVVDLLSGGRLP